MFNITDSRRRLKSALTGCLLICFFNIQAQEMASPLDIPLYLSGNFGELRSNHFHSGLDFKTQGATGQPVRAVDEGYISRIGVSPYGYGNALYIDHPDGKTSVYGHLERFAPQIEALVRDSQYRKESFSLNI
jgi:murein DD-endopeptidase MepM/ murein hydrolase activator NlpD